MSSPARPLPPLPLRQDTSPPTTSMDRSRSMKVISPDRVDIGGLSLSSTNPFLSGAAIEAGLGPPVDYSSSRPASPERRRGSLDFRTLRKPHDPFTDPAGVDASNHRDFDPIATRNLHSPGIGRLGIFASTPDMTIAETARTQPKHVDPSQNAMTAGDPIVLEGLGGSVKDLVGVFETAGRVTLPSSVSSSKLDLFSPHSATAPAPSGFGRPHPGTPAQLAPQSSTTENFPGWVTFGELGRTESTVSMRTPIGSTPPISAVRRPTIDTSRISSQKPEETQSPSPATWSPGVGSVPLPSSNQRTAWQQKTVAGVDPPRLVDFGGHASSPSPAELAGPTRLSGVSGDSDPFGDEHGITTAATPTDDTGDAPWDVDEDEPYLYGRKAEKQRLNSHAVSADDLSEEVYTHRAYASDGAGRKSPRKNQPPPLPTRRSKNPFGEDLAADLLVDHGPSVDRSTVPDRPPLPPRPTTPGQRTGTAPPPNLGDYAPRIPARPVTRAVEEALEIYNASPLNATPSLLDTATGYSPTVGSTEPTDRFSALRQTPSFLQPNASRASRRLPLPRRTINSSMERQEAFEINTKHSGRAIALSADVLCVASSEKIRVYDTQTVQQIISRTVTFPEQKIYSICFAPCYNVTDEGRYLWVGLDKGEIAEITFGETLTMDKRSVHSGNVTHLMKYHGQIWSLDDSGCLKVWNQDRDNKRIALNQRPTARRLSPKITCAAIAKRHIWFASGRTVDVMNMGNEESTSGFCRRPDCTNIGSFTALAAARDEETVVSGHDDGKIVVWSASQVTRLKTIATGIYRVTSLACVSTYVWAGFGTGKISVYDTSVYEEWDVLSEFPGHQSSSVDALLLDPVSVISNPRRIPQPIMVSLSDSGQVRLWDALLRKDWIYRRMVEQEAQWTVYDNLNILVCTWNIDSCKPCDLQESPHACDHTLFRSLLTTPGNVMPDVILFSFQELVDLESKSTTAKLLVKKKSTKKSSEKSAGHRCKLWVDQLTTSVRMQFGDNFEVIRVEEMVGLLQLLICRKGATNRSGLMERKIIDVQVDKVKTGLKGYHGNKGGIASRIIVDNSSICFVTAHLAAHQNQVSARNNDISTILKNTHFSPLASSQYTFTSGGDGSYILDHEAVIISGDLNYRIDLPRERVIELIRMEDWATLLEADQLRRQMMVHWGLRGFKEGEIGFKPTFKLDPGELERWDTSEKRRVPAWCDRILYRGPLQPQNYSRHDATTSDHRPVSAMFTMRTKKINPLVFAQFENGVEEQCDSWVMAEIERESVRWVSRVTGAKEEDVLKVLRDVGGDVGRCRLVWG
ncbi:hypothetical protein BC832DRAFT_593130 [Gaertneriomyces semiglobifer]|nr:hypothetical protein BC832DRAFT_593130 [Gaertneriomyces semiglobifer]